MKCIYIMHQIFDVGNFIVAFKACVHYFYFCHQNKTFNKLEKILFFIKKAPFVLKIFKFLYFPLPLFFRFLVIADFIEEVD